MELVKLIINVIATLMLAGMILLTIKEVVYMFVIKGMINTGVFNDVLNKAKNDYKKMKDFDNEIKKANEEVIKTIMETKSSKNENEKKSGE